jgi:hypothetical protein
LDRLCNIPSQSLIHLPNGGVVGASMSHVRMLT